MLYRYMYLKVKVTAGAKKESFEKKGENFVVSVKEKAQDNRANSRVLELLSEKLDIPKNKLRIVKGHKMGSKLVEVLK